MSDAPGQLEINRRRVIEAVRIAGRMARIELAEATALSPATVTALTAELIAEGFLEEASAPPVIGAARRGRPRVQLMLRPGAAHVAGVKISMHQISVSISNFVGDLLGARTVSVVASRRTPDEIAAMIDDALRQAVAGLGLDLAEIDGVGVALPGFVDSATGISEWSPIFGHQRIDFGALMRRRLGRPVFVDNDANLATLAQQWFGHGKGLANFITVTIEHGVGMGVVIDGRLYRGARGIGAEFGHMKMQRSGALCRCGQRGCIEAYLADYAILREASTFYPVTGIADPIRANETLSALIAEARAGDHRIRAVYARAGEMLGIGLSNLINVLGPDRIILTGMGVEAIDLFEGPMREALAANTLSVSVAQTPVLVAPNSEALWAHGAAALVLQRQSFAPRSTRPAGAPPAPGQRRCSP